MAAKKFAKAVFVYATLLDENKLNRFRRESRRYGATYEVLTNALITAAVKDSKEDIKVIPFRVLYDRKRRIKRLVSCVFIDGWNTLKIGKHTFYYPHNESSLFTEEMSREEFEQGVNKLPLAVDMILGRPDLLNIIYDNDTSVSCIVLDIYENPGVVEIHSVVEIKDSRFLQPHQFADFGTIH